VSRTGRVRAHFGGEEREFLLAWGELMQLQESRDAGPGWIQVKFMTNQWKAEDVAEVIRLGLIGGGETPQKASRLVKLHVEQEPHNLGGPDGLLILALRIITAGIQGSPEEPPGKAAGEIPNGSTISPTARSDSDHSSALLS
jgi:hypothetical protein